MRLVWILTLGVPLVGVNCVAAESAKMPRRDIHGDLLPEGAIARLGTVRFQPPGDVRAIALSPDGKTVASAVRSDKTGMRIDFLATSTGQNFHTLDLEKLDFDRMQFTPDGKELVFCTWSGVDFVDARAGQVRRSINLEHARDSNIALSPDGKWLAAQPQQFIYHAPIGIWDTTTGQRAASLPGRGADCRELAFSADGKRLLLRSIVPNHADGKSMGFDSQSRAALASIDLKSRKIVGETTVGSAQYVALSADGETVALESADHQSVRVRHLPTGERCVLRVKDAKFAFAPDGKVLFTVDHKGRGALWNATTGDKIRDLDGTLANKDFHIVGIAKDKKTIAVLDGGWYSAPIVVVWNAVTGKRVGRPPCHEGAITCLAYTPDGKFLVSGSLDKTVRLWDPAKGEQLRQLTVHREGVTAVAISPDGKRVASSDQSGAIRLSNISDGKLVSEFSGLAKGATALAFSPEGTVLFAGGDSAEVITWEIASAKEMVRLKTGQDGAVMALSDGGSLALTGNGEIRARETPERLQVWNLRTKLPIASLPILDKQGGRVRCDAAIFSPGGRLLASSQVSEYQDIRPSYGAALLRLWERASGQPIRTLAPTITTVLAFSTDGRLLAAGGSGESGHLVVGYGRGIDLWDTLTGKKVGALPVSPWCVAFCPDRFHLATGGRDHTVLIWEVPRIQSANKARTPSTQEREVWWTALGGDCKDAYKTMEQMIDAPEYSVALLAERLRPVQPSDPDVVAKLVIKLDSETYTERVQAQDALEKMGEAAAHLLANAVEGKVSLEVRRRLEQVLAKCDTPTSLGLRHHRAVAILEWIDTPSARALLRTLSKGAPGAHLTIEARVALKRLTP